MYKSFTFILFFLTFAGFSQEMVKQNCTERYFKFVMQLEKNFSLDFKYKVYQDATNYVQYNCGHNLQEVEKFVKLFALTEISKNVQWWFLRYTSLYSEIQKYRPVTYEHKKVTKLFRDFYSNFKQNHSSYLEYKNLVESKEFSIDNQAAYLNSLKREETCTSVDLRRPPLVEVNPDQTIKKNIMRRQGNLNWCYAYAAADHYSFMTGQKVSALGIRMQDYRNQEERDKSYPELSGGVMEYALNSSLRSYFCRESDLPSQNNYSDRYNLKYAMRELDQVYQSIIKDPTKDQVEAVCGVNGDNWENYFPNLTIGDVFNFATEEKNQSNNSNLFLENIFDHLCVNPVPTLSGKYYSIDRVYRIEQEGEIFMVEIPGEIEKMKKAIDDLLNTQQIVLIAYDSKFVYNSYDTTINFYQAQHASNIVARRFNQEKRSCEYLVRNVWGSSCKSVDPDMDCDEGNFWADESLLYRAIDEITYYY